MLIMIALLHFPIPDNLLKTMYQGGKKKEKEKKASKAITESKESSWPFDIFALSRPYFSSKWY